jgi:hypothetical protein
MRVAFHLLPLNRKRVSFYLLTFFFTFSFLIPDSSALARE